MKRVCKTDEPKSLAAFRNDNPDDTWDDMRAKDRQAVRDCLEQAASNQKGLCAYCEKKINLQEPHHCRIEHFHPKSDSVEHNWHLDWNNMLATCDGGESGDKITDPLPENLSCDAHKNRMANKGHLPVNHLEDSILNPLELPLIPNIFTFNPVIGCLAPVASACKEAEVDIHKLERTIEFLNLNCNRLKRARITIYRKIKRREKELLGRQHSRQKTTDIMLKEYFGNIRWPEYFTTYRCCLGQAAEKYLRSINYNG